jgi:hypothetical protein
MMAKGNQPKQMEENKLIKQIEQPEGMAKRKRNRQKLGLNKYRRADQSQETEAIWARQAKKEKCSQATQKNEQTDLLAFA